GQGKPQIGDLFNAWDCFVPLFLFVLINIIVAIVLHSVPFFGSLATIALGFVVLPGAFLIVDRGAQPLEAYKWCIETIQADFVTWLVAYLVGNVITFAGFLALVVGVLFTAPLGQLIIIQQYERAKPGAATGR
ncbi:MAG TPA: zinc ribbon domain-containing protein, partial [Geobacteraceae bacterium]